MNNLEKYIRAFTQTFDLSPEKVAGLERQSLEAWDSIGHVGLVVALEEEFAIMMEPDDIAVLTSFEKGQEVLKKYNIEM